MSDFKSKVKYRILKLRFLYKRIWADLGPITRKRGILYRLVIIPVLSIVVLGASVYVLLRQLNNQKRRMSE